MVSGRNMSPFTETTASAVFANRLPLSTQDRLPLLVAAVAKSAHDLIRDFRPTRAEWAKAIEFLTEVGHAADERRQEWVLLADLIGASALVEEINSRRPKTATQTQSADRFPDRCTTTSDRQ